MSLQDYYLYIFALFILVLSPGPVVAAIVSRVLANGWRAGIPIALGVVVGDLFWVTLALFGVSAISSDFENLMIVIRWLGAAYLFYLGVREIQFARKKLTSADIPSESFWASFVAAVAIILSNPKAILFYISIVPSFFNASTMTKRDIALVIAAAVIVPFIGNLVWGGFAHGARKLLRNPESIAKLRIVSGSALILVALALPFI